MKSLLLVLACVACGSSNHGSADATPSVDARNGVGCTATTPRTIPPDTFIGPTDVQNRVGAAIDAAQHTLDIQMYLFTVRALADKVIAAHQRGVAVRVLLDPDEAGNSTARSSFTTAGVPTRNAASVYQYAHAKYLIVDSTSSVIMSANLNADAMTTERNYGMIDRDPEDIADLQQIFDYDWALAAGMTLPAPDLACTRLIVSPANSGPRIQALIASAASTLDVEAFYVSDVDVRNAIGAAKARGVTVRVILDDPSDQPDNATTKNYFAGVGVPVHYVTTQFYLHAKLIVADGTAFVGSENLSYTALTQNREVGALVFEPTPAAAIQQQFDTDWANTPVAP